MMNSEASAFLGKFQLSLDKTRRCERSNSSRARLFRALHEATARFGGEDGGLVHDLRMTSAFDENEERFQGIVSRVLCGLNSSSKRVEAAEFILLAIQAQMDEIVLERATEVVKRRNRNAENDTKTAQLLIPILEQFAAEARLDRALGRR
jgi:hypothetical protein